MMNNIRENEGNHTLTIEEIEKLSYYDFMSYFNVPFFTIGGIKSVEQLADLCEINENSKILEIGCGTGFNSVQIAKKYGCEIIGIDISENMIDKARERVIKENLTEKIKFEVGNAYDLQFEDKEFDVIITIFVSQFLDLQKAFIEFKRVLKDEGRIGINEMGKEDEIPFEIAKEIDEGEHIFRELTDLPFTLYSPKYLEQVMESSGLKNIKTELCHDYLKKKNFSKTIKEFGGWKQLFRILGKMMKLSIKSKKIRKKFSLIDNAKRKLISNRKNSKYTVYILCKGEK